MPRQLAYSRTDRHLCASRGSMTPDDFRAWLRSAPAPALLDGGLSAALACVGRAPEADDPLWTSRLLLDGPHVLADAATAFYAVGADIASTATYQVSQAALATAGVCHDDAAALMRSAVALACGARGAAARAVAEAEEAAEATAATDAPAAGAPLMRRTRRRPLVALSLGPYAAALGDGAEYRGYDPGPESEQRLDYFHRRRAHVFFTEKSDFGGEGAVEDGTGPGSVADVAAFETIPAVAEAEFVTVMMTEKEMPGAWLPPFWIAFQCQSETLLASGEGLYEGARAVLKANRGRPGLVAIGVNCCDPAWVGGQVRTLRQAIADHTRGVPVNQPDIAVVVYPNSGETWGVEGWSWPGEPVSAQAWAANVMAAGADIVGGCCRCAPDHVSWIPSEDNHFNRYAA